MYKYTICKSISLFYVRCCVDLISHFVRLLQAAGAERASPPSERGAKGPAGAEQQAAAAERTNLPALWTGNYCESLCFYRKWCNVSFSFCFCFFVLLFLANTSEISVDMPGIPWHLEWGNSEDVGVYSLVAKCQRLLYWILKNVFIEISTVTSFCFTWQAKKRQYDQEVENLEKKQKQTIERLEQDHTSRLRDEAKRIKADQDKELSKFQNMLKNRKKEVRTVTAVCFGFGSFLASACHAELCSVSCWTT